MSKYPYDTRHTRPFALAETFLTPDVELVETLLDPPLLVLPPLTSAEATVSLDDFLVRGEAVLDASLLAICLPTATSPYAAAAATLLADAFLAAGVALPGACLTPLLMSSWWCLPDRDSSSSGTFSEFSLIETDLDAAAAVNDAIRGGFDTFLCGLGAFLG